METKDDAAERQRKIEEQVSRDGMRLLTGGLTHEGDTFLIAAGAFLVMVALYPLVGAWSLLAFPVVTVGAVVARSISRKRRGRGARVR